MRTKSSFQSVSLPLSQHCFFIVFDGKDVTCLLMKCIIVLITKSFLLFKKTPLFVHGLCLKSDPCGAVTRNKYLERNSKLKIRSKNHIVELKVHCGMKVNVNCGLRKNVTEQSYYFGIDCLVLSGGEFEALCLFLGQLCTSSETSCRLVFR